MATRHSTAPARAGERPRLPSTQPGPVTVALRTMRQAEPEAPALVGLRQGLEAYFTDAGMCVDLSAQMDVERNRIHELREAISNRKRRTSPCSTHSTATPILRTAATRN